MVKDLKTENKVKLTPSDARAIWECKHSKDHSNLVVDYSLFYKDHCKVHPIDLLLDYIKRAAAEKEEPICYFYEFSVFNNLDYEEKKVKRSEDRPNNFWQKLFHKTTHHEWEEKDWEHLKHYHVLADNIMNELWIYLLKAGWKVEYYRDSEYRKYFKIYF